MPRAHRTPSLDLFDRLAVGQFVNDLVEVADYLHQRLFDLFCADAADYTGDLGAWGFMDGASTKTVSKSAQSAITLAKAFAS